METFGLKLILLSIAVYFVGRVSRLYHIENFGTALLTAFVLAIVNAVVRPIFIFLTLPITILTLGLFLFFANGLMLLLVAKIVPKFKLYGCFTASVAALLISLCTVFIRMAYLSLKPKIFENSKVCSCLFIKSFLSIDPIKIYHH